MKKNILKENNVVTKMAEVNQSLEGREPSLFYSLFLLPLCSQCTVLDAW